MADDYTYLYVRRDYDIHPPQWVIYCLDSDRIFVCHRMDKRHNLHDDPAIGNIYFPPQVRIGFKKFIQFTNDFGQPLKQQTISFFCAHLTHSEKKAVEKRFHEYKANPSGSVRLPIPQTLLSEALSTMPTWGRRSAGQMEPVGNLAPVGAPYRWLTAEEKQAEAAKRRAAAKEREAAGRALFERFNGVCPVKSPSDIAECMRPATDDERARTDMLGRVDRVKPAP